MNAVANSGREVEVSLDHLAADLASAAYGVALKHGLSTSWIDLEIEMWKEMTGALQQQLSGRTI